MERISRAVVGLVFAVLWGAMAAAQQAVPEFRYVVTSDMDFYGSDLDALFDTDLPSCLNACSANGRCTAFTYNTRSRACFPKSGVSERKAYQGALSAEKLATPAQAIRRGAARQADLGFLRAGDLERARDQGRELGLIHRAGGLDLQAVMEAARERTAAGDSLRAAGWTGAAVSLTDSGALWTEYARLLLDIRTDNDGQRRDYDQRAQYAATNGYLRAENDPARVTALQVLGEALERRGRGRDMLAALRLASEIQPRDDILSALDAAIQKYGFRIVDSSVESDSDAPRICAEFSENLVRAGVDYEPFVKLPEPGLVVQAQGSQLCVDGLEHGKRYRVTFRKGLPAASGETLYRYVELTHYVRDRSQNVRFPGRSY
ncbi:MAG: PAN domain-containing protein, partial [Pseudodonghicola sp.]